MDSIEWVPIPGFTNYEVNKDGDVRNAQTKKIQLFGKKLFLYGGAGNRMRIAIHNAMRVAFGDDSVDKSNALVRDN